MRINLIFGQNSNSVLIHDIAYSINMTNIDDDNTDKALGPGIGVYHFFFLDKNFDLRTGLEFNATHQKKKLLYNGHSGGYSDLSIFFHSISIPLLGRYTMGKKYFENQAFSQS